MGQRVYGLCNRFRNFGVCVFRQCRLCCLFLRSCSTNWAKMHFRLRMIEPLECIFRYLFWEWCVRLAFVHFLYGLGIRFFGFLLYLTYCRIGYYIYIVVNITGCGCISGASSCIAFGIAKVIYTLIGLCFGSLFRLRVCLKKALQCLFERMIP